MPIQIQEIKVENETPECPLCMESLEVDDINFFPCVCGYQVCRFCWHRIRTDENGLCPACRTSYPEDPAEFRPLTGSDLQKIRHEKRQKEVQRRQKLTDGRRHLSAIRVLQKNLVFVIGLSQRLSDAEVLKRHDYFGKYGKILKVVINNNTAYAGAQSPSCSAYVTYSKMEEALKAIQYVNNVYIDGRTLKASLGTTKYCSTYLKNQQCHKSDCMYLHELADEESSFTKEEMQVGKHQLLEQRLVEEMISKESGVAASVEIAPPLEPEKPPTQVRRHSGSSGSVQPENSWAAGMSKDQGLSARLVSSMEEKSNKTKDPFSRKTKKTPPRSANKNQAPTVVDSFASDSGQASSECSSLATTPPPTVDAPPATDSRLAEEGCGDSAQQPEIPPTSMHSLQPQFSDENKPETMQETPKVPDVAELSNATNSLYISEPEEPPQIYQPFQRFSQPNDSYSCVSNPNFPLNHLLSQNIANTPWNHESNLQQSTETTPNRPSSYWETALGLSNNHASAAYSESGQTNEAGEDELGFDPWLECSKGFADLIEKERAHSNLQHSSVGGWNDGHSQQQQPSLHNHLLSGLFLSGHQDHQTGYHLGRKAPSGFPSAFTSDSNQILPFNSQANRIHDGGNFPTNNLNTSKSNLLQSPTEKRRDEWQNGLRALLPSVNINFATDNPTKANASLNSLFPPTSVPGFGRSPAQNLNLTRERPMFSMGFDGWVNNTQVSQTQSALFSTSHNRNTSLFNNGFSLNPSSNDGYNSVLPPPGLSSAHYHSDPAIVSSGNKAPSQHTPASEEPPHWMRSLQTLTDSDTSTNLPTSTSFFPVSNQAASASFTAWPSMSSNASMPQLGNTNQPPPGFQSKFSFSNTSEFGIHHSLLENQS